MFAAKLSKVFPRSSKKEVARKRSRSYKLSRLEHLEERRVLTSMYDVQWLGVMNPSDNFSSAQGINDKGQIVGDSYISNSGGIPSQEKAFSWTAGGGMVDLGALNGNAAYAWDVNNSGTVAGWYHYPVSSPGTTVGGGYYEWAFVDKNGAMSAIPGYAQIGMNSVAYGVNDNNIVVGHADVPGGAGQGEAFTYDGTMVHFLGTLGGKWSYGMDINNSNVVAGFADTGQNPSTQPGVYVSQYHAVLWTNGVIQDLGTLGGDSYAYKVNDLGMAVGSSITSAGYYHPFLFDGPKMIDLGGLAGNGEALSINNQGQVVGDSGNWLNSTAFVYENGAIFDLNTLVNAPQTGDQLMRANDINNLGQIVGYGMHNGHYEAFLLTPAANAATVTPTTPPTTAATSAGLATPDIVLTGGTFNYDGLTHAATATAFRNDGITPLGGGFAFTYNGSSALPTAAGTYSVVATFTSNDPNYSDAVVSGTITIDPAAPKLTLSDGTFAEDGKAHAASAVALALDGLTPVNGTFSYTYNGSLAMPTAAGTYAVVASFTSSDPNYASATAQGVITITPTSQVVFSQSPNPAGGLSKSAWYPPDGLDGDSYAYDNFTLASTSAISEIAWRGGYTNYLSGAGESPVSGFTISIYGSINGAYQPDVVHQPLAQYDVAGNAGETPAGTFGGVAMYDYKFTLPTAFQAVAGTTYWVQIEASQGVTPTYYWPPDWGIAWATGGDGSHFQATTGGTNGGGTLYQRLSNDLAFTLKASPVNALAAPAINLNGGEFAYDGQTHSASATALAADGVTPVNGTFAYTYNGSATPPTDAGIYAVAATFTSNDPNYASATASGEITINAASPALSLSGGLFAYNAAAHAAGAAVGGLNGAAVSGTTSITYNSSASAPVDAGSYLVVATWTSADPNYANATATSQITIAPAAPLISVQGGAFAYDGASHAASATVVGADGVTPVAGILSLTYNGSPAAPSAPGAYTVVATFTSNDLNYASASATGSINIAPVAASLAAAAPTLNLVTGTFAFDGAAHGATATAVGVDGLTPVSGSFALTYNGLATAPSAAGTYAVVASFTSSDPNYANATVSGTLTIGAASPTLNVIGGSYIYDATVHAANATAVGVDGVTPVAGSFALTYNGSATAPSAAGTYAVVTSFTSGDPNYANATVSGTLTIGAASPTLNVIGGSYIYDATAHTASAKAVGVDGSTPVAGSFALTYNGSATAPTAAGTYAVVASFTSGDPNYANATISGSLTIAKATPVFSNLSSPTVTTGAASTTLSGHLAAGSAAPVGDSVTITVNGVSQTAAVDTGGNFSASFATSSWKTGTYSVVYAFAGDANFNAAANGSSVLTVNAAPATGKRHQSDGEHKPDSDRAGDGSHETLHAADLSAPHAVDHLAEAIAEAHEKLHAENRVESEIGEPVLATATKKHAAHDRLMAEWDS